VFAHAHFNVKGPYLSFSKFAARKKLTDTPDLFQQGEIPCRAGALNHSDSALNRIIRKGGSLTVKPTVIDSSGGGTHENIL